MFYTARSYNGMVVSPHRLASQAGITILRQGGHAVEAAVAVAAALCVVYPHMTGLGGDGFWLILPAGEERNPPLYIDACGRSAAAASRDWYQERGFDAVPARGPAAALTMAGAVSGWELALQSAQGWDTGNRRMSLDQLFEDAIGLAERGFPVSRHMHELCAKELPGISGQEAFVRQFLPGGNAPARAGRMKLPALAETFRRLAKDGLDSFYRGELARDMAEDLRAEGSPLALEDFTAHKGEIGAPLQLDISRARLYNSPPPTQGLASLAILGILDALATRPGCDLSEPAVLVHCIVEATKQAFGLRNRFIADPDHMLCKPDKLLSPQSLALLTEGIALNKVLPWSTEEPEGDTVWLGVMDRFGNSVSCIQSIYHGFGAAVTLPRTGITWHNRGLGFYFRPGLANSLEPGKKPMHTLNPAMARFPDGRIMAYGTMGGDGQPQTQAALFARHAFLDMTLQASIAEPRWVIGRTWGEAGSGLKIEENFAPRVLARLMELGHKVEPERAFSSRMGHAGALVRFPDGLLEGAFDPRSDGSAACW